MRYLTVMALTLALGPPTQGKEPQHIDPGLRGNWTLNVAKGAFGPDGPPTAGTVRWTEHGWVTALVFANGYVYADAVLTDQGCALIGVPSDYTCRITVLTPTHIRFILSQAGAIRRVGDIELIDSNTTRSTHRVTPADAAPYTRTTVWLRDRD